MIEYVKKSDVLEIINSPLPRDLTAEYIFDLKGVWLDEDEADTPQTDCETCRHYKLACELFSEVCKYEPTTQNSNLTFETDTPQTEICDTCKYRSSNVFGNWCVGRDTCDRYEVDTPQTDCETCKYGEDKHRYAHICNECGVGINNYTPQTERSSEK